MRNQSENNMNVTKEQIAQKIESPPDLALQEAMVFRLFVMALQIF
jgi:hypothetical protein